MAEIARRVERLRSPYREAMFLQKVLGYSRREVIRRLCEWRRIGIEGARQIIRRGHRKLTGLAGSPPVLPDAAHLYPPLRASTG